jgi:hypothetical protein
LQIPISLRFNRAGAPCPDNPRTIEKRTPFLPNAESFMATRTESIDQVSKAADRKSNHGA